MSGTKASVIPEDASPFGTRIRHQEGLTSASLWAIPTTLGVRMEPGPVLIDLSHWDNEHPKQHNICFDQKNPAAFS